MNSFFIKSSEVSWQIIDEGIKRKILGYNDKIMMVLVDFSDNIVAPTHHHFHSQCTYILSGTFEVIIDGKTSLLKEGDSFVVPPNKTHGVKCIQSGLLLDAFSPIREDFLIEKV